MVFYVCVPFYLLKACIMKTSIFVILSLSLLMNACARVHEGAHMGRGQVDVGNLSLLLSTELGIH